VSRVAYLDGVPEGTDPPAPGSGHAVVLPVSASTVVEGPREGSMNESVSRHEPRPASGGGGAAAARPVLAPPAATSRRHRLHDRLAPVHDTDGPRVRLGLLWLAALTAAEAGPEIAPAVLFGGAAGLAAWQLSGVWRQCRLPSSRVVATGGAAGLALVGLAAGAGADSGVGAVGAAVLAVVAGALVAALSRALIAGSVSVSAVVVEAGCTLQCALVPGLAGAGVVVTSQYRLSAGVALVLVVAAYDCGSFLVGAGAPRAWSGPAAGAVAATVVVLFLGSMAIDPLTLPAAWAYVAVAVVGCPAGQYLASAVLPEAGSPASALRRLDGFLLTAPAWAVVTLVWH
jgi:hypothetical protein